MSWVVRVTIKGRTRKPFWLWRKKNDGWAVINSPSLAAVFHVEEEAHRAIAKHKYAWGKRRGETTTYTVEEYEAPRPATRVGWVVAFRNTQGHYWLRSGAVASDTRTIQADAAYSNAGMYPTKTAAEALVPLVRQKWANHNFTVKVRARRRTT